MREKRPVIKLPLRKEEFILELISLASIIGMILIIFQFWADLPQQIPTHFGTSGQADEWGNKNAIFQLPVIAVFLYLLLTIINQFPHIFNYPWKITEENARIQYQIARISLTIIKTEILLFFTYVQWSTIQVSLGKYTDLGILFLPIFLLTVFGTLGAFIYVSAKHR